MRDRAIPSAYLELPTIYLISYTFICAANKRAPAIHAPQLNLARELYCFSPVTRRPFGENHGKYDTDSSAP